MSLTSASKEDITLSLGTKWSNAVEEKERQGQVIAHLTNQLEALKSVCEANGHAARRLLTALPSSWLDSDAPLGAALLLSTVVSDPPTSPTWSK